MAKNTKAGVKTFKGDVILEAVNASRILSLDGSKTMVGDNALSASASGGTTDVLTRDGVDASIAADAMLKATYDPTNVNDDAFDMDNFLDGSALVAMTIAERAKLTSLTNSMIFKGSITLNSDFPTSAAVDNGWTYTITADVTDNDGSKTNTGQSFQTDDEITWNGSNWTILGMEVSDQMRKSQYDTGLTGRVDNAEAVNDGTKSSTAAQVYDHRTSLSNPHSVNKNQLSLGNVVNTLHKFDASAPPVVGDDDGDGFSIGSVWLDITNDRVYQCMDASTGAAIWLELSGGQYELEQGGVSIEANAVATAFAAPDTWYKFALFDTNMPNSGEITSDQANNRVQIVNARKYKISIDVSVYNPKTATNTEQVGVGVSIDGGATMLAETERTIQSLHSEVASFEVWVDLAASKNIELYLKNVNSATDFTITYAHLSTWTTRVITTGFQSANETVDLLTSDSTADKQSKIDAVPKVCANGSWPTVTFRFADGTHTETDTLYFNGFQYPVIVEGNAGDAQALSTAQSVFIDISAQAVSAISITGCVSIQVNKIKTLISDTASIYAIYAIACAQFSASYNYWLGAGKTNSNAGLRVDECSGWASANYGSNTKYVLQAFRCLYMSIGNDDTGTLPDYGLSAAFASAIGKSGTQPTGSVSNETTSAGGVIR